MLKQRVITAVVLTVCFLSVLFFLPWQWFAGFTLVVFGVGAWEWSRLAGITSGFLRALYVVATVLLTVVVVWATDWTANSELMRWFLVAACTWWVFSFFWIQGYPGSALIWGSTSVRMLMGLLVIIPAWVGCYYIRSQPNGEWLILFVVFLVASADIGAFFSGKAFGANKLAPEVSPGKSWEGVWGGLLMAALLGIVFNFAFSGEDWLILMALVIPTALVSIVGDLLESMLKRHSGMKDSSQLLPGHGGVLDRIDGLVAAVPVFSLALIASSWQL